MEGAKSKIMEVATQLFADKGYAAVSIRELTVAADVNVSAISYYFGGKEGLYKEIVKQQFAVTEKILETVKSRTDLSPVDRLKLYMQMHSDIRQRSPLIGKFMNSEMSNPTPVVGPTILEHINQISFFLYSLIKEGMEAGYFKKDLDPAYCAVTLAGILNFYFHAEPLVCKIAEAQVYKAFEHFPKELDSKKYINHAIEIYLNGLANK